MGRVALGPKWMCFFSGKVKSSLFRPGVLGERETLKALTCIKHHDLRALDVMGF